jgi:2-polyprenyl-3-methyl-5-hydroxy-6-metoxy-1,4-benzoquinol methylase
MLLSKYLSHTDKNFLILEKINMNTKIYKLLMENLRESFKLPKYQTIYNDINEFTVVKQLPWTPARFDKFKHKIETTLDLSSEFKGTVKDIVDDLDIRYSGRFFGEIWKPSTEKYSYTGWQLVEEINKMNPKAVLDVGCGYNQFKDRIPNLVGIDPYNNCADYQVDILEFSAVAESFDAIMALGSINFNSKQDIEQRLANCVKMLAPNGKMFFRVNPGIQHEKGPWVDVFPWSFEIAHEFAKKFNLTLDTFKKDANNRLYFVYSKA